MMVFLFIFEKKVDRTRFLGGIPWSISSNHIIIKNWPPDIALDDLEFGKTSL